MIFFIFHDTISYEVITLKQIQINSIFDDTILYCNIYEVENPIAIVQIVHGMM